VIAHLLNFICIRSLSIERVIVLKRQYILAGLELLRSKNSINIAGINFVCAIFGSQNRSLE
jgi:hypothetical protein